MRVRRSIIPFVVLVGPVIGRGIAAHGADPVVAPGDAPAAPVTAPAPPTTEPAVPTLAQAKARGQAEELAEVAQLPVVTPKTTADLMRISIRDDMLHVTTSISPQEAENAVVHRAGLSGITTIQVRSHGPDSSFNLKNVDFATPDGISLHTTVLQSAAMLNISQELATLEDDTHTVQFIQHPRELNEGEPRTKLFVQITSEPQVRLDLTADNIVELRRKHPAEVAKYLDPIFRKLRQDGLLAKVDPKLIWQIFADAAQPSQEMQLKLKTIVTRLGSETFQERESASAELESLGQPAALALMAWNRDGLNDEQTVRLDAFLARFKIVDEAEAARLRKDPDFLLDCLAAEDPALRRRVLDELRQLSGKQIAFDVDADPTARLDAIARLRQVVGAPAATQATRQIVE